jgi:hypothetical protein
VFPPSSTNLTSFLLELIKFLLELIKLVQTSSPLVLTPDLTRTRLCRSQWWFHECFKHIKYSATSAKFHFLHETLRREKERVSPWWNLWSQFHMSWKLCETPIETQIEFHHATMQLNHTMRERLWDTWAYETVQWNHALRETSISYQSFTSGKPERWNSPLRLALCLTLKKKLPPST